MAKKLKPATRIPAIRARAPIAIPHALALLNIHDVEFHEAPSIFSARLGALLGQEIGCLVSCPPPNGNSQAARLFHRFSASTPTPTLARHADLERTAVEVTSEHFGQFETSGALRPSIWLLPLKPLKAGEAEVARHLTREFFTKLLHRQRALLRREVVEARAHSGDLSSFLHRLVKDDTLGRHVGFRAASVFVLDPVGNMLRLKGSTGLKGNIARSDIAFGTEAKKKKVPACFRTGRPLFEFSADTPLPEGDSAEKVLYGPYARAYWPIQLVNKLRIRQTRRQARPRLGVIRITNARDERLPFNWLTLSALEFTAEALYNIILGFAESEESAFKREESFHSAGIVLDSVQKNIARSIRLLFDRGLPATVPPVSQAYTLQSKTDPSDTGDQVRHLLMTAYASAMDISYQVERANFETSIPIGQKTEKLYSDVLLRAIESIPYMCIAHSVREPRRIPDPGRTFAEVPYPPPVFGPPGALTSVFWNVFENAVKYRRLGKELRIDMVVSVSERHVDVVVRDYGIGISADDAKKIPSRYYRSDRAKAHVARGSGLGLVWCSDVLKRDRGELLIRRMPTGLEVTVRLRRADV